MSASAPAPSLLTLVSELAQLMTRETTCLLAGDVRQAANLLPRKDELSRALASRASALAQAPSGSAELREEVQRLMAAARANAQAISAATAANERLFRAVAEAAGAGRKLSTYGPSGRQSGSEMTLALGRSL